MTYTFVRGLTFAIGCSLLVACASTPSAPKAKPAASTAQEAVVNLASASGSLVSGRLILVPMGDGVHITGEVGGLKPGDVRGFHIHDKGDCSAADASSAGGHFNPGAQAHGRAGQGPHHAGDTDNIVADAHGVAPINAHVQGVSLGGGVAPEDQKSALAIHPAAGTEEQVAQPASTRVDLWRAMRSARKWRCNSALRRVRREAQQPPWGVRLAPVASRAKGSWRRTTGLICLNEALLP